MQSHSSNDNPLPGRSPIYLKNHQKENAYGRKTGIGSTGGTSAN